MGTSKESARKISVWNGRVNLNFRIRGQGPALVYFHPAAGFAWDPFLETLAESYTIHAPEFPGTTLGDPVSGADSRAGAQRAAARTRCSSGGKSGAS